MIPNTNDTNTNSDTNTNNDTKYQRY